MDGSLGRAFAQMPEASFTESRYASDRTASLHGFSLSGFNSQRPYFSEVAPSGLYDFRDGGPFRIVSETFNAAVDEPFDPLRQLQVKGQETILGARRCSSNRSFNCKSKRAAPKNRCNSASSRFRLIFESLKVLTISTSANK